MYINTRQVSGLILDWDIMNRLSARFFPRERRTATVTLNRSGYPCLEATMRGQMRRQTYMIHDLVAIYMLQEQGYSSSFLPAKPRKWVVHHINMNRLDARPENLVTLPESVHNRLHSTIRQIAEQHDADVTQLALLTDSRIMTDEQPESYGEMLMEIRRIIDEHRDHAADMIMEEYRRYRSI